eukprot:13646697-Alexandrium_andersonii.AAC.1
MERIRRRSTRDAPAHVDPARPWGAVFQKACSQSDTETQAYWDREVIKKSLLFVLEMFQHLARASTLGGPGSSCRIHVPEA